jgi:predicted TIM-barrel fold metal-dependent hydrolase
VALKSIAAYRSGLEISSASYEQARCCFYELRANQAGESLRLSAKLLIDFLLAEALRIAVRHHLPLQLHCGFGDADLDLRRANPLHLKALLDEPAFRQVPVVLLHAGYPFVREAGYLAAIYSRVYVDFGLALPFLSVAGMKSVLQQLLELTPITKLLYSSDAHMIPEHFYLGAKWGREALAEVLEGAVRDGDLTVAEAESAAERILLENALELYGTLS